MRRMFAVWLLLVLSPCVALAITREGKQREIAEALFKVSVSEGKLIYGYNDYRACFVGDDNYCEAANNGDENGYLGGHSGDDFAANYNPHATFYSLTDGEVINVSPLNTIAIYDGTNTIVYLHASDVEQIIKDKANSTPKGSVRKGDPLGKQGEKGNAMGLHVHVEVRKGWATLGSWGACASERPPNIDPVPYLYGWVIDDRAGEVMLYDVNDDERVDWDDVLLVYFNMGTYYLRYDVNCDSEVDWADVLEVYHNLTIVLAAPTARSPLVDQTSLLPNYPNPFNPETWIPYSLVEDADVKLTIYDIQGTEVRRFDLGQQPAGHYTDRRKSIYWDGRNMLGEQVVGGVYFYHLQAGNYSATRRMVILK